MIDYINNRKHLHLNRIGAKNTYYPYKNFKKKNTGMVSISKRGNKKRCKELKICWKCKKPLTFLFTQPNAKWTLYAKCSCGQCFFGRGIVGNQKRLSNILINPIQKHIKTIKDYAESNFRRYDKFEMKVYYLLKAFFNFKVERQFIIDDKFIADIYIPIKRIIIEIDGEYHNIEEQKIKDKEREDYIKSKGFEIIRFRNEDVRDNLLDILEILQEKFSTPKQDLDNEYETMIELKNT